MLDPWPVRLMAVGIVVLYAAAVVLFRPAAHAPVGRPTEFRRQDNPPAAIQMLWAATFIVPNLYPIGVALLPAWTYGTAGNFAFPFDSVFQVVGLGLWLMGGGLAAWGQRALGRHMIIQIAVVKDHELIMDGPYARIRHPAYAGVQFMAIGLALFFLSYALLALAVVAVVLANYRAQKEERLLSSEQGFGAEYREYMRRSGRFLPRLGK